MHIQTINEGAKNFSVLIKGIVTTDFGRTPVVDLKEVQAPREGWKGLRLDSALWLIEEKMGLHLWWEDKGDENSLVLPMESRNSVRFEGGLKSPRIHHAGQPQWPGLMYLSSFGYDDKPALSKAFMVVLDFDKQ